ncbi:MAG: hypothetical protein WCH37_02345 [Synechococcaceae cyanobacterium ELA182]
MSSLAAPGSASGPAPEPLRILVASGGLIHLVHQLAVVTSLPEVRAGRRQNGPDAPPTIGIWLTGVIRNDPHALASLEQAIERWLVLLRSQQPHRFGAIRLLGQEPEAASGDWDLLCLNNQWQRGQRQLLQLGSIRQLVVCGDGLGIYYRCARELRAILPSLLNRLIAEPGRQVRYVLSGRQPLWHRPPQAPIEPPLEGRAELFELLVESQRAATRQELQFCLTATDDQRPLWICSVPNLAHQFHGRHIPFAVLVSWQRQLQRRQGFDPCRDRLLLIDHPKAPADGSFGRIELPWLAGPLRSAVSLEVMVRLLQEQRAGRPVIVAGLTSALYGVSQLTGAEVSWLSLAPLWRHNRLYRRQPLEFLHRCLRVARMALLTGSSTGPAQPLIGQ